MSSSQPDISQRQISDAQLPRVAVIGSGYWGKNLVRNYAQLGALRLICDKNETILDQFRRQYPQVDTCLTLGEILPREDIDALVIATPAETHFTLAREAIMAGKHVYVEKPLVLDEREGRELIAMADKRKTILMVGHLLQFHPVFVKLRELVEGGELGRINYIYSHRLNLGKIRREENILWSFAPHDISMILTLAGEEPESVRAMGANYLHKAIADVTTTHLEFPSGLKAHIFVSWLHPYKEQKLVVVGDQKMAVFDDTLPWKRKLLLYPHMIRWEHQIPVPAKAEPELVEVAEAEPLKMECEHFLNAISTGRRPRTDGHEGLAVLRVLNASQRSLDDHTGRISLPIEPKAPPTTHTTHTGSEASFFVHPSSIVDEGVTVGSGTKIWHFCHVIEGSRIGERCNIGQNVVVGPDVSIGNACKIQNNVSVYKGVTLEDEVFCGPSMVFTNVYNPRAHLRRMDEIRPTLVRKGATLGANCTIVCGVTIGSYAFVGAGAVVTRDVPAHALIVGNPGRRIGYMCTCGVRLGDDLKCSACGEVYEFGENQELRLIGRE